jgi:hypothetical protein
MADYRQRSLKTCQIEKGDHRCSVVMNTFAVAVMVGAMAELCRGLCDRFPGLAKSDRQGAMSDAHRESFALLFAARARVLKWAKGPLS